MKKAKDYFLLFGIVFEIKKGENVSLSFWYILFDIIDFMKKKKKYLIKDLTIKCNLKE